MTRVFIGGSRRITRLSPEVTQRLDRIVEQGLEVVIGDANGADRAVQEYLHRRGYDLVEVFCSGDSCRNNIGGWPVRTIRTEGKRRDFSFYAAKDRAMADEASRGLMLWDRESVGTLMNVMRLVRRKKPVVMYVAPDREFIDIANDEDWSRLVAGCARELRDRVERESSMEIDSGMDRSSPTQPSLF